MLALVRTALIGLLVWVIPVNNQLGVSVDEHSPHLYGRLLQNTYLTPIDLILLLLLAIAIPDVVDSMRRRSWTVGSAGLLAAAAITFVATVLHPSLGGLVLGFRLLGGLGLLFAATSLPTQLLARPLMWALSSAASFQGLLALGQTLLWDSGRPGRDDLAAAGADWTPGLGTFNHEYALAAFLTLAIVAMLPNVGLRSRRYLWVATGIAGAAIATSFGRTAAIALFTACGIYLVRWAKRSDPADALRAIVPLGAFLATAVVTASGWLGRATVDSSIRVDLARRAVEIIGDNPLIGVGPVRYGAHLAETGLQEIDHFVVHNVPLLTAAEFGIVIGLAFVVWVAWLGVQAFRGSLVAVAAWVAMIPYLMLDNLHYVYPAGVAMFAAWLSIVSLASTRVEDGRPSEESVSPR